MYLFSPFSCVLVFYLILCLFLPRYGWNIADVALNFNQSIPFQFCHMSSYCLLGQEHLCPMNTFLYVINKSIRGHKHKLYCVTAWNITPFIFIYGQLSFQRAKKWAEGMDHMGNDRLRFANILMETLEDIEQQSGIFLIKPMYSFKGR